MESDEKERDLEVEVEKGNKKKQIAIDPFKLTARLFPDSAAAATTVDAGLFVAAVAVVTDFAVAPPPPLAKNEEIVRWPEEARGADILFRVSDRFEKERERV